MKITFNTIVPRNSATLPVLKQNRAENATNLNTEYLNQIKHFKPYPSFINFTSTNRIQRNEFPLAKMAPELRCPSCGDRMENFNKVKARKLAAEISKKRGKELQEALLLNREEFQSTKRELVDELITVAGKYPKRNFSELLEVLGKRKYIDKLRTKQLLVTTFLGNEILNLSPENMAKMVDWQKDQVIRIMQASDEGDFRNKYLITSFINYALAQGIKIDETSVRAYFAKLPNSKKDVEAYVVKYMRREPMEAVYRLIKNTEPTVEHIVPFSKSGNNGIENLLLMCSDCNTARGDMTYKDYVEQHPEMKENIENYFMDIKDAIKRRKSSKQIRKIYETYENRVKRTIENYSPGTFDFN